MADYKLTALELVLTFLTMFGPVTKESLAAVCVLFEAILGYDCDKGKFDKDAVKRVCGVADHLLAMAELYGVKCNAKQLGTPGGRRAILRVILGPVLEGLGLEDLEQMRNDAVEAMMILTFKPLDEVQDMLTAWSKQAIKDGRYQERVYSWTGLPMESSNEFDETESSIDIATPTASDMAITTMTEPCGLALEIVFTFLTMFGPVTKESVAATGVLFEAVLGYSEATGKFDKGTAKKVPAVSERLCSLAQLYGIRCEPRMLGTPPGARAILRELVGPIIEGHSPEELEEMRQASAAAIMVTTCKPLEEVETMVATWAAAAREDGRYQARASAWTGKPVDAFNHNNTTETDQHRPTTMDETYSGIDDNGEVSECRSFEDRALEDSVDTPLDLEIATSTTITKLVTVQALFAMDILPKQEAPFTTMFPTPLDVCLGRPFVWTFTAVDGPGTDILEATMSHPGDIHDFDEVDDVKELMDESDEEDYHRLVGFHFPALSPPTPVLGVSTGTTPEITPLGTPTFEQWITTWHSREMTAWKAILHQAAEKEAQAEERKAMFGPHADAWESKQLSDWSAALKDDDEAGYFPGIYAGVASADETEVEILEATNGDDKTSLLKTVGRFFGLA